MDQSNLSKIFKAFKLAYPYYFKTLSEEDSTMFLQLYYSKLKEYKYEIVAKAVDNLITTSNFMPSLADVIKECDRQSKLYYRKVLEKMYKENYFKTDEEYGKSVMWLLEDKPIIPKWLKGDIDKFIEINKTKQIEMEKKWKQH